MDIKEIAKESGRLAALVRPSTEIQKMIAAQARAAAALAPPPFMQRLMAEQAEAAERVARQLEPMPRMFEQARELTERFRRAAFLEQIAERAKTVHELTKWLTFPSPLAKDQLDVMKRGFEEANRMQHVFEEAKRIGAAIEMQAAFDERRLQDRLSTSIDRVLSITPPPHPGHETNEHLRNLNEHVEELLDRVERAEARADVAEAREARAEAQRDQAIRVSRWRLWVAIVGIPAALAKDWIATTVLSIGDWVADLTRSIVNLVRW